MDTLIDLLAKIPFRPLGTVVHLGAGGTDATAYAALQACRLVLVDGRPEAVDELRALALPAPTRLEVVPAIVAATTGPLTWFRHNLPWLDGPVDTSSLTTVYPRLTRSSAETRSATAVAPLLAGLLAGDGDGATAEANVLLIDLPGQEAALLDALDAPTLAGFGWIAVRAGSSTDALAAPLAERFFEAMPGAAAAGELWPVALFRRATRRAEQTLRARNETLARQLETLSAQLAEATERADAATVLADARGGELETLRRELDALRDECQRLAGHLDAAGSARRAAEEALAARQAALDTLQATVAELRADQTRMSAAVDAAQGTLDEWRQRVTGAESSAAAQRAELQRLEHSLAAAQAERDTEQRARQALAAQLAEAAQQAEMARTALADREVRQRLLDAEILRAEAQLELVKDVLLREKNF